MSGRLGERLTSPRIQHKAKTVSSWTGWFDTAGVGDDTSLQDDLDDLIDLITAGHEIPERYYRKSPGGDRLLKEEGIMHLHLKNPGSDVIVYLVQFDDEVLLLGTGTHAELAKAYQHHWRTKGARSTPADQRAKLAARLKADQAKLAAQVADQKRIVAIARLKAKAGSRRRLTSPEAPAQDD